VCHVQARAPCHADPTARRTSDGTPTAPATMGAGNLPNVQRCDVPRGVLPYVRKPALPGVMLQVRGD